MQHNFLTFQIKYDFGSSLFIISLFILQVVTIQFHFSNAKAHTITVLKHWFALFPLFSSLSPSVSLDRIYIVTTPTSREIMRVRTCELFAEVMMPQIYGKHGRNITSSSFVNAVKKGYGAAVGLLNFPK